MIKPQDFDVILDNSTDVVDPNGDKIGGVGQIYVNDGTGDASFVTVRTGLFGMRETFVPLDDAEYVDGVIKVPFTAEQVKDAPQVDEGGAITPQDEDLIYAFYGVDGLGGTGAAGGIDLQTELPNRDAVGTETVAGEGVLDRDVHTDRSAQVEQVEHVEEPVEGALAEPRGGIFDGDRRDADHIDERHDDKPGILDRDWSDSDGDGQRLERVDGEHDPQDGMVEGNEPRDGEGFGERIFGGADRGAVDDDHAAVADDVAFGSKDPETRRDRARLRRYDRTARQDAVPDDGLTEDQRIQAERNIPDSGPNA